MNFCSDVDLLHWEPNLLRETALASQNLLSGTGTLSGTSFTISAGSLVDSHVAADQVILLSGTIAGSYPIVSVDSATELTLSALYDGLVSGQASPVGSAAGLGFTIRSFWAQRKVVSDLLRGAIGLESEAQDPAILNPEVLRRPCVLGTLQMIYGIVAAASAEPEALTARADLYERLFRRALRAIRVELDLNGDGEADCARSGAVLQLVR